MTIASIHSRKHFRCSRFGVRISMLSLVVAVEIASPFKLYSQTVDAIPVVPIETSDALYRSRRYALIVVSLPGDEEHREKFSEVVGVWQQWLTEIAGVEKQDLMLLNSDGGNGAEPATAKSIRARMALLSASLTPEDSLWVFLLGHGSQDERHGWFHLPGPDLSAGEWADLFALLKTREQLFWMTHSASGSFLKPLSRPGRVVVCATDDAELNETRFPYALAEIMQKQLKSTPAPDTKPSKIVTVLELFRQTAHHVDQSFEDDKLVPTEHAQLDDNGDGVGTEAADVVAYRDAEGSVDLTVIDGATSDRIQITLRQIEQPPAEQGRVVD